MANMPRVGETKFILHGLDADNRIVRAAIFVQKCGVLIRALSIADKLANGKSGFDFVISGLEIGSTAITIREKQRRRERPQHSSITVLERTASAIYNGDRTSGRLPPALIEQVQKLGKGVAKKFSHAELAFAEDNVIRIDDFLLRQSEAAFEEVTLPEVTQDYKFYRGLAMGSFDGVLKEIDARGTMLRGKLLLSAGGLEIDCVMNKERVPEARESFDKRVVIHGAAHYDGTSQIPTRLDVAEIRVIGVGADLLRWKGAFRPPAEHEEDEW